MRLRHHAEPRQDRGNEAGESLTEILVTLILLTVVVVAILSALQVVIRTAALNKEKGRSAVAIHAAVEKIKEPVNAMEYRPCNLGPMAAYQAQLDTYLNANNDLKVRGYAVKITGIQYLQGTWNTSVTPPAFTPTGFNNWTSACQTQTASTVLRDGGAQRITVQVKAPSGAAYPVKDTLVIIKRDGRCPDSTFGYQNVDAGPC